MTIEQQNKELLQENEQLKKRLLEKNAPIEGIKKITDSFNKEFPATMKKLMAKVKDISEPKKMDEITIDGSKVKVLLYANNIVSVSFNDLGSAEKYFKSLVK